MTIADKVIQTKTDYDNVYHAGRIKILEDSKYMHPTVSGEIIRIDDMSKVPHKVTIGKRSDTVEDLDAVKVYKYGKNLFTTIGRNNVDLGAYANTTQRKITENSYYVGLTGNNYYEDYNVINYDISNPNSIMVNARNNGYGLGFSFKVRPNETYTFSVQSVTENKGSVRFGFYTQEGIWLKMVTDNNLKVTATVPENAYWMTALLTPSKLETDIYFNGVMLEMSNTNTEYEPYHKEEIGETFDSTTDIVTLMTDTSGVILDCQYLRDIDKYIDSLNVAVAMTGGA